MVERYTRPQMGKVWTLENRFNKMLEVEVAVAKVQADMGLIPKAAAKDISTKSKFDIHRILEIEKTTKHDVIAFVSAVAENVGKNGRYIHYGLTSSDVIDTAMSLLVRDGAKILNESLDRLEKALFNQSKKYSTTLCSGRTHGMHAEPTSLGMKLAGFHAELLRNRKRFSLALEEMQIAKLSGAVGTYSTQSFKVEEGVAKLLKLKAEDIATQVVPRDRHAQLMLSIALIGCFLERLCVEFRHLQRTEVGEVVEGFSKGQKGSSAMPHKKNPISSENVTGAARLLRAYSQASMENVALWHERDISHSSVERVAFPDAFILCDYALDRMAGVVENIQVNPDKMLENMNASQGQLFSSHVLLSLVEQGLSREEAYAHVQRLSHGLKPKESLKQALLKDKELKKYIRAKEIEKIFSGATHIKSISLVLSRYFSKSGKQIQPKGKAKKK